MSKFSDQYYDPNHPGYKSRIAIGGKLAAIVKMNPGKRPPEALIRMHIAADIYTIDAYDDELQALAQSPDVISIQYSRPVQTLVSIPPGNDK